MGGLTCCAAGCITFLVCTSVWQAGDGCRTSVTNIRMQSLRPFKANDADNKAWVTDVSSPDYSTERHCDGFSVSVRQTGGPYAPRWYNGKAPAEGFTKTTIQDHYLQYRFSIQEDVRYKDLRLSVEVDRCRPAGFTSGDFQNGRRMCSSNCVEKNVKGAICEYSCNAGFKLVGQPRLTCQDTGWNGNVVSPPHCQVVNCGSPSAVPNADLDCPEGHNYNKKCYVQCHSGYQLTGSSFTVCQQSETWTDIWSPCRDSESPTFPQGCVPDIEVAAAPVGQDTVVSWTEPAVLDNSGNNTNVLYRLPGSTATTSSTSAVFQVGVHNVVVYAKDKEQNTEVCFFTVTVKDVTCPHPNEQLNVTYMIYRPNPYGPSPHGTNLSLSCDRGYPQHGAKVITCQRIGTTYTARWTWEGDTVDMKPNCIVKACPDLTPPKNGALSCFSSNVGTDCLMSCSENYDIPEDTRQVSAGRWTCVNNNPTVWFPTAVPDCARVENGHVYVQAEIFYFSGSCNDSIEYLQQAFVERMKNNSLLQAACQTACVPANVQVFCGEIDPNVTRRRRSADQFYVKITFQVAVQRSNTTTKQEMTRMEGNINTFLKQEVTGNGSLVFDGLTTDNSSVRAVSVGCDCPSGKTCNNKFMCVGCSKGHYMPVSDKKCHECPVNTYQEDDGATACVPCPAGSFTESTGSYNSTQCIEPQAGGWGEWSMWPECSLTCGGGQQHRQRRCDSPAPEEGGRDCQGLANETRDCGLQFCPVDGAWSEWSDWAVCSATCGGGETTRARQCDNPAAQHGGLQCSGPDREVKTCNNETSCPVHGGWGEWSDWTPCSASCEGGTQSRDRQCNNPVPSQGGSNCTGQPMEIQNCNTHECPTCPSFVQPQNTNEPVVMVNGEERNVSVECLTNYVWAMSYEPQFYCGPDTYYTWSTDSNFTVAYEPPFCSEMIAVTGGSGQFNIPMKHECINVVDVLRDIKQQVDSNLDKLLCKNVQNVSKECVTAVLVTCDKPKSLADNSGGANNATQLSRKKRSADDTEQLTLVVDLSGKIGDNNTQLKQGTPEFDEYMRIMQAVQDSVRQIFDQADLLFTLRVNGQDVLPEADKISADGNYHCPSGTGMQSGFCVKCSAGTYEDRNRCLFCPVGQYQDEIGRTECKDCPAGFASTTVGAYSVDQCSEPFEKPMVPTNDNNPVARTDIALIVGVSFAAVAVAVAVIVTVLYVVKRAKMKSKTLDSSLLSLSKVHPDTKR